VPVFCVSCVPATLSRVTRGAELDPLGTSSGAGNLCI
jgi:hypothetical protein